MKGLTIALFCTFAVAAIVYGEFFYIEFYFHLTSITSYLPCQVRNQEFFRPGEFSRN